MAAKRVQGHFKSPLSASVCFNVRYLFIILPVNWIQCVRKCAVRSVDVVDLFVENRRVFIPV